MIIVEKPAKDNKENKDERLFINLAACHFCVRNKFTEFIPFLSSPYSGALSIKKPPSLSFSKEGGCWFNRGLHE